MNHAPIRMSRRSGIAVVATVFVLASLLGSVADAAAKPVRHFRASLTPSCVLAGMRQTLTGTITNDTTSNQVLGSAFFDTTVTAFSHIDGTPPFVVTASAGKHWTALREDAVGTSSDRNDLDGIYLKANSTVDALSPGQSVTVTFQATVGSAIANRAWTVSAWQSTTPRGSSGGTFSLVGSSVSVQVATTCPATHLAFLGQPSNAQAGVAISPSVTVQVLDATNTVVSGASTSITLAIGTNAGGGTLSGTKTVNASGGVATFPGLSIDKVGTGYTLTASATGLTGATSNAFNITTGTAANIAFVAAPSDTEAGGTMADVTVKVTDAGANPVSGESVTLASAGLATTPSGSQTTGLDGIATFSGLTVKTVAGSYSMTASDAAASLTTGPASFNVTAGPPAITFTKEPTDTLVTTLTDTHYIEGQGGGGVEVTVADTHGNPVPDGTSVALSLIDPTGVATLGGTTTETTSAGVATFSDLTIDTTSTGYQLHATSGSLQTDSDPFAITNTDTSCDPCTAQFSPGHTVSGPAGTTLIIETNQLDCSGVTTIFDETVTMIPADPNTTTGVPITFDDTLGPLQTFYPFCKTPNTTEIVPSCDNLPLGEVGLDQPEGTVPCVVETIVLHGLNPPTLHSVLWINGSDPGGRH